VPRHNPYAFATRTAESFVKDELKVTALGIDPISIAKQHDIHVEAMEECEDGVSGMLIHAYGKFAIAYATHIKSEGFQNFSVGHELGHYFLPGHIDALLPPGTSEHKSRAGFVSDDRYELEADHFAAGLLMPSFLFKPVMVRLGESLDAAQEIAALCGTSLTATAIRLQELTDEAVAVIQCSTNRVEFCCMSDRMLTLRPRRWPKKGDRVPQGTGAAYLMADPERVLASERKSREADGVTWFGGFDDVELYEESIGLGRFGRTLTILTTVDNLPDEEDDDSDDGWNRRSR
jgi:hypothetical protein